MCSQMDLDDSIKTMQRWLPLYTIRLFGINAQLIKGPKNRRSPYYIKILNINDSYVYIKKMNAFTGNPFSAIGVALVEFRGSTINV